MKYLYSWLQEYIEEPLPKAEEIAAKVNAQAFELEGTERVGGDTILEFDIKPNRTHDAWAHRGMAREIAALFGLTYKMPESSYTTDETLKSSEVLSVSVPDPIFAPRVMKRIVVDVKVGESPKWLKARLEALGQRSINNIVDIVNFVMLETGQPAHAFDLEKISVQPPTSNLQPRTRNIYLRKAKPGESIETLDGKTYNLNESVFLWADDEKALDIAGIKGGAVSGIDKNTKSLMLSVCNFNPVTIRTTSRGLNLITDASKRYEQGLSPELTEVAMHRLCALIQQIAGGRVSEDVIDLYPRKRNPYLIGVSVDEVNKLLGSSLATGDVEDILRRLGFEYKKVKPIDEVVRLAPKFVGVPYKYGASISYDAPKTFDCSAFTSYLYAYAGFGIPRVTIDQFAFGDEIEKENLQPGDLVFSHNDNVGEEKDVVLVATGKPIHQKVLHTKTRDFLPDTQVPEGVDHVGLYLGDGKIIHASGEDYNGKVVVEGMADSAEFQNIRGYRRIASDNGERYVVTAPSERLDLHAGPGFLISGNKEDLIEEIGRIYGYDNIAPQPLAKEKEPELNKTFYYANKIRDSLVSLGFSEVYTYSLVEAGEMALANPLASDKAYLRPSLEGGLKKALEQGVYYKDLLGTDAIKIFEIGTVFDKDGEHLELGIAGENAEDVLQAFNRIINDPNLSSGKPPLKQVKKEFLGFTSDFSILDEPDLDIEYNKECTLGIANLSAFIEGLAEPLLYDDLADINTAGTTFAALSPYPFVLRDIAMWVPSELSSADVEHLIRQNASDLLVRVTQFDEYKKDSKTSYAFHLVFQSHDKTLSDGEVNAVMRKIEEKMKGEGWRVR